MLYCRYCIIIDIKVLKFRNKNLVFICGVENVYRMGFKVELIGSINIVNYIVRFLGEEKDFFKIDLSLIIIMGI